MPGLNKGGRSCATPVPPSSLAESKQLTHSSRLTLNPRSKLRLRIFLVVRDQCDCRPACEAKIPPPGSPSRRNHIPFARRQKQVLFQAMLPRIQIEVPSALRIQLRMRPALHNLPRFHHQNLVRAANC